MAQPNQGDKTVKELVQQHWNGRAATFDDESQHGIHSDEQHDRWLTVLREWTGDDSLDVLDVGCGTGVVSILLAELGHAVIGVDFAPEMLERARAKARRTDYSVTFQRGDAEALALPDDTVDLVTARHLVWTLPRPTAALQEWQRVVEPGGRILLIEGYWDHDEPWDEYEQMHDDLPMYDGRPPDELRDVLADQGFADITHEPLMDATLWGREPHHDYYIMSGTVPR
ncbi:MULTISPECIES: class I SAM-dependent methyltransferase [Halobacteriales]|uniref:Class I SAM-dependent methyltransferase n=1 Tax=Halobaculum magnesiiphilum TaxID=1017351 RepID=A0A8T8WHH7_9EURY|nr:MULTISPECIES: class I SAM-dependent methyltransferase [Halobacteria]QZP39322.1 class I SAM-dependent methyltransferase [Halobaculum magnesiiphilum]